MSKSEGGVLLRCCSLRSNLARGCAGVSAGIEARPQMVKRCLSIGLVNSIEKVADPRFSNNLHVGGGEGGWRLSKLLRNLVAGIRLSNRYR